MNLDCDAFISSLVDIDFSYLSFDFKRPKLDESIIIEKDICINECRYDYLINCKHGKYLLNVKLISHGSSLIHQFINRYLYDIRTIDMSKEFNHVLLIDGKGWKCSRNLLTKLLSSNVKVYNLKTFNQFIEEIKAKEKLYRIDPAKYTNAANSTVIFETGSAYVDTIKQPVHSTNRVPERVIADMSDYPTLSSFIPDNIRDSQILFDKYIMAIVKVAKTMERGRNLRRSWNHLFRVMKDDNLILNLSAQQFANSMYEICVKNNVSTWTSIKQIADQVRKATNPNVEKYRDWDTTDHTNDRDVCIKIAAEFNDVFTEIDKNLVIRL